MEEAPENGKELSHFAQANGMNENITLLLTLVPAITDYMWFLSSELHSSNSAKDRIHP